MTRTTPSPSTSPVPIARTGSPDPESSFVVVSYNLWHNKAAGELSALAATTGADVLCIQEATTAELPEALGDLRLVVSTGGNRLGLAVYVRGDRFEVEETRTVSLGKSMHDRVMSPTAERLVAARVVDRASGSRFVVASFHAAPLSARNSVRRTQITAAHHHLDALGPDLPQIMIGDYNYPWFAGGLARMLRSTGHTLTRPTTGTYRNYGVVRGKFDVATTIKATLGELVAQPKGASDHFPIAVTVSL